MFAPNKYVHFTPILATTLLVLSPPTASAITRSAITRRTRDTAMDEDVSLMTYSNPMNAGPSHRGHSTSVAGSNGGGSIREKEVVSNSMREPVSFRLLSACLPGVCIDGA